MVFAARVAALALTTVSLAGCYRGSPAFSTYDDASIWPYGIATPSPTRDTALGAVTGIYPSSQNEASYCCWLAPSATFEVRIPPHASALLFTFFVPAFGPFKTQAQRVSISIDGAKAVMSGPLRGAAIVRVPLAPNAKARVADIALNATLSFTPKNIGLNDDTRELALYLRAVSTR
jgi:hypothetical protein